MPQYYNASIRNLVYRLRKFKDILSEELKDEIMKHEDVIVQWLPETSFMSKVLKVEAFRLWTTNLILQEL